MISLSSQLQLLLLGIVLYLYDSCVLLYSNEGLLIRTADRRWISRPSKNTFVIVGRVLWVLNPLTPHRPSFRLNWSFDLRPASSDASWTNAAEEMRPLAPLTLTAGTALFVMLPIGLFSDLGAYAVIPGLLLFYSAAIFALVRVRRLRLSRFSSPGSFFAFAFECLACPPFAVNMVRRITLAKRVDESLLSAGARLLIPADWDDLRRKCLNSVDEALESVSDDSDEVHLLEAKRQQLQDWPSGGK